MVRPSREVDSAPIWRQISPMLVRYDMRRDGEGYTVFDVWTGWPATVANVEQVGLDIDDADDLVDLLNLMNERRQAFS
jgi:hypothetical protein